MHLKRARHCIESGSTVRTPQQVVDLLERRKSVSRQAGRVSSGWACQAMQKAGQPHITVGDHRLRGKLRTAGMILQDTIRMVGIVGLPMPQWLEAPPADTGGTALLAMLDGVLIDRAGRPSCLTGWH